MILPRLPRLALSVRQPWAWAIIYGGKDIENRSDAAIRHMNFTGVRSIDIHASKGMTRDEYDDAHAFMASIGVECPPAAQLLRGGIIGSVDVVEIVRKSSSNWFFGPRGIRVCNPFSCDFVPAVGRLGLFAWSPADAACVPPPAKWMFAERAVMARPPDLLEGLKP